MELPECLKHPVSLLISAKRLSGKTYLIKELINNKKFNKQFEEIYIFSSTANLDKTWNDIEPEHCCLFDNFENDELKNIMKSVKKEKVEEDKSCNILIVVDDFHDKNSLKRDNVLNILATRGRHFNISFVYSVQKYNSLPLVIRTNCLQRIFFRIINKNELDIISEENSTLNISKKDLGKLLYENTKEKYNYVLIEDTIDSVKFYNGNGLNIKPISYKPSVLVL